MRAVWTSRKRVEAEVVWCLESRSVDGCLRSKFSAAFAGGESPIRKHALILPRSPAIPSSAGICEIRYPARTTASVPASRTLSVDRHTQYTQLEHSTEYGYSDQSKRTVYMAKITNKITEPAYAYICPNNPFSSFSSILAL